MDLTHLTRLATLAADVASIDGGEVSGVTIGECADGSHRSYALVDTIDGGLEQQYRITTPAPATAPGWAQVHAAWMLEVRVGDDNWLDLEAEEQGLFDDVEVSR
jgi:hypothetical protein